MTIQSPVQPPSQPTGQPLVPLLSPTPLGVGDLLDRSFRLYRRHFKQFLYMAAVLLLPWAIFSGFFTQSIMQNQLMILQQVFTQDLSSPATLAQLEQLNNSAQSVGLSFLLSLVGGVLWVITFLALTTLAIRTLHGESATLGDGFTGARRNFWASVRLGIIIFLAFLGLVIAMSLVFGVLSVAVGGIFGGLAGAGSNGDALGVFLALCCIMPIGFALVFGPFIYLGVRWSVVTPALVHIEDGATGSMRTSWELTKGNMWRIIGYFFLVYLLSMIIFAVPFYMVQAGLLLLLGLDMVWLSALLGTIVSAVLTTLWLPMTAIFPTMLYFDLRTRDDIANGRSNWRPAAATSATGPATIAGASVASTPPYTMPSTAQQQPLPPHTYVAPMTDAPAASPSAPAAPPSTSTSTPTTPLQTPYSWSQSDEPDDPWATPSSQPSPPSDDKS